ncbi:MAG: hypothetical protein GY805_37180 [Chloroflexi bacterium]|nr:hypothetical protein [Chloroflexota bacterium]
MLNNGVRLFGRIDEASIIPMKGMALLVLRTICRSLLLPKLSWQDAYKGRFEPIGDDFDDSSLQVLDGINEVPGLAQSLN